MREPVSRVHARPVSAMEGPRQESFCPQNADLLNASTNAGCKVARQVAGTRWLEVLDAWTCSNRVTPMRTPLCLAAAALG